MLTTIASGRIDHAQVVVEKGAVPIFVRLLVGPNDDICEQAVSLSSCVLYYIHVSTSHSHLFDFLRAPLGLDVPYL